VSAKTLAVEVVSAGPGYARRVPLALPAGATVAEALAAAAAELGPLGVSADTAVAIFGTRVARDRTLADGDRIELLRPLLVDPKEQRRLLARQGRTMGRARPGSG
jgi:uncharacterized protein